MASYKELFPHDAALSGPRRPIRTDPFPAPEPRRAIQFPTGTPTVVGEAGLAESGPDPIAAYREAKRASYSRDVAPPNGEVSWGDQGKQFAAGAVDLGATALALPEYVAGQMAGSGVTREQQAGIRAKNYLGGLRKKVEGVVSDIEGTISPEARERAAREWLTLDPNKTIWQGGADEFLSSFALKFNRNLPSTAATLLPAAAWARVAGIGSGAVSYLGASEAALSTADIARNISNEIDAPPDAQLTAESPRYAELRTKHDETEAKRLLVQEAQGIMPVVAGTAVGVISALGGRYLEPVLTKGGGKLTRRALTGFTAEAAPEGGQSYVEQVAQNVAAQVYDQDRKWDAGAAEAAVEGAAIGGGMGAGAATAFGSRPTPPAPPPEQDLAPATPPPAEEPPGTPPTPPPAAPEPEFDELLGPNDQASLPFGQAREDILQAPQTVTSTLRGGRVGPAIALTPVPDDIAAAMAAVSGAELPRSEVQRPDGTRAPTGQLPYGEEFAARQQAIPMSWGEPPPPPRDVDWTQPPGQLALPMRNPATGDIGEQPVPITPDASEDLSQPEGTYRELSRPYAPSAPLPIEGSSAPMASSKPGRRSKAQLAAQAATRGVLPPYQPPVADTERLPFDENQPDLFPPEESAPTVTGTPVKLPSGSMSGYEVLVKDKQGRTIMRRYFPPTQGRKADLLAEIFAKDFPNGIVTSLPIRPGAVVPKQQTLDEPTAEPVADLLAQLEDLRKPGASRLGVYLSADNIENLRANGQLDKVRSYGPTLINIDGKGGTVIAKDRETAAYLRKYARETPASEMQRFLGELTGAGTGKPMTGEWAVQQRDADGAVVRESLAGTEEDAYALSEEWDAARPELQTVVLKASVAIKRRASRIAKENESLTAERSTREAKSKAEFGIDREVPEPLQESAQTAVRQSKSAPEVVRSLARTASTAFGEGRRRAAATRGLPAPADLKFSTLEAEVKYKQLHDEYLTAADAAESPEGTVSDRLKRQVARTAAYDRAVTHLRINKQQQAAAGLVKIASEVDKKAARKLADRTTRDEGVYPSPEDELIAAEEDDEADDISEVPFSQRGTVEPVTTEDPFFQFKPLTDEQINALSPDDLLVEFVRAAYHDIGQTAPDFDNDPRPFNPEDPTATETNFTSELHKLILKKTTDTAPVRTEEEQKTYEEKLKAEVEAERSKTATDASPEGIEAAKKAYEVAGRVYKDIGKLLEANSEPGEKKRFIKRQSQKVLRYPHGRVGKRETGGTTLTATDDREGLIPEDGEEEVDQQGLVRRTSSLKYGVLYPTLPPQKQLELGTEERGKLAEESKVVLKETKAELAKTGKFINSLSKSKKFADQINERDEKGALTPTARNLVYAKAYVNLLAQYAASLTKLEYQSTGPLGTLEQLRQIGVQLSSFREMEPGVFANTAARLMMAELNEQGRLAVPHAGAERSLSLGARRELKTREQRLESAAKTLSEVRAELARRLSLERLYATSPDFTNYIAPLLRKFSDYTFAGAYGEYGQTVNRKFLSGYTPTSEELQSVADAYTRLVEDTRGELTALQTLMELKLPKLGYAIADSGKVRPSLPSDKDKPVAPDTVRRVLTSVFQIGTNYRGGQVPRHLRDMARQLGFDVSKGDATLGTELRKQKWTQGDVAKLIEKVVKARRVAVKAEARLVKRSLSDVGVEITQTAEADGLSTATFTVGWDNLTGFERLLKARRPSGFTIEEAEELGRNGMQRQRTVADINAELARQADKQRLASLSEQELEARAAAAETKAEKAAVALDRMAVARSATLDESVSSKDVTRLSPTLATQEAIAAFKATIASPKVNMERVIKAEEKLIAELTELGVWEPTGAGGAMGKIKLVGANNTNVDGYLLTNNGAINFRLMASRLRNASLTLAEAKVHALKTFPDVTVREDTKFMRELRARRSALLAKRTAEKAGDFKKRGPKLTPSSRESLDTLAAEKDKFSHQLRVEEGTAALVKDAERFNTSGAAQIIADELEYASGVDESVELAELLNKIKGSLSKGSLAYQTVDKLLQLNLDGVVRWQGNDFFDGNDGLQSGEGVGQTNWTGDFYRISLNRDYFNRLRSEGVTPTASLTYTLLHEALHVATMQNLMTNRELQKQLGAILNYAASNWKGETPYGLTSISEMVAEVYSNPDFRQQLSEITLPDKRSLLDRFIEFVKRALGFDTEQRAETALESILLAEKNLFDTMVSESAAIPSGSAQLRVKDTMQGVFADVVGRIDQTRNARESMQERSRALGDNISKAFLPALTMEQMATFHGKHFRGPTNGRGGLHNYIDAFFQRNASVTSRMEGADRLSRDWTALEEKDPEGMQKLSQLMTAATLQEAHVDLPLSHEKNKHLVTDAQKAKHRELAAQFNALSPDAQQLYKKVSTYYSETISSEIAQMTLNMLRSYLTKGENAKLSNKQFAAYTEAVVHEKKLNTQKGLEEEFGDALPQSARRIIARAAALPETRKGPYFPIMRNGDFVVYAEKSGDVKRFNTEAEARAYRSDAEVADPTADLKVEEVATGVWRVTSTLKDFRMFESRTEAEAARREMAEEYGHDFVTPVQKRAALFSPKSDISTNPALTGILSKLEGNAAAQAAVKNYYLQALSDSSFRKREIKRAKRAGFNPLIQHRSFTAYASQAAFYISQLEHGWKMADALRSMRETTKAHRDESSVTAIQMADIVEEITKRDEMQTSPQTVSKLVKGGVELSHFLLLTTPSYWFINLTQPYTVTLPWLAARHSMPRAVSALKHAQSLILDPLVREAGSSWGGLRALQKSSAPAEKAFTVLTQVEQTIKERGGARAKDYIDMLETLKKHSIIDLSFIAELRDIADGVDKAWTGKVLDASRIMAHLTEVNNRIVTALASYELARNTGLEHTDAIDFAKQAVSTTQFNYSAGNKPRLFQSGGPLGAASPLLFQFLQYPQHMYALLVKEMQAAVQGGVVEKRVARKTLAGIFATHLAAGGIIGATLQPLKWAIGLAIATFDEDDDEATTVLSGEKFETTMREVGADLFGVEFGRLMTKGLPAAAGYDLSQRMSLGTMYQTDFKTDTPEALLGSIVSNFGGATLGLGVSAMSGLRHFAEGNTSKALESVLPKAVKDIMRAYRYADEGVTTRRGVELLKPSDMTPAELFMQGLGFQATKINEQYEADTVARTIERTAEKQKELLSLKFVNADSAEERKAVMEDVAEYNKRHPEKRITMSSLLQAKQRQRMSSARIQAYGVDVQKPTPKILDAVSPYSMRRRREQAMAPARRYAPPPTAKQSPLDTLFNAVEYVESRGNPYAVSPVGAVGPMQTMPTTLRDPGFGVTPARNSSPAEQRRVGREYLLAMLKKYENLDHALVAYNWGPSNADRWISRGARLESLPRETREYLPQVRNRL